MNTYAKTLIAVIAVALVGVMSACDNPVEDDPDHDEHAEAEGLILSSGGNDLVRVENAQVSDTLVVPLDGSIEIEVEFLDDHGDHIHAEDLDEDLSLAWEVGDEGVLTVTSTGAWTFSTEGVAAGSTHLTVKLMHGDHADFTTPEIPVRVE